METIKQILMKRDGMTEQEADNLIEEARQALNDCLDNDEQEEAGNICQEYFGLEPDFIMELIE